MADDDPNNPDNNQSQQPYPPGTAEGCKSGWTSPTPPTYEDPKPCPPNCDCPADTSTDPTCLETLIIDKTGELAQAERTKKFKADLEALLAKATAAAGEYTLKTYEDSVKRWVEQDTRIANFIRDFVCGFPCWKCAIECYICRLLHKMNQAQQKLYWDPTVYPKKATNLYDVLFWRTRDKEVKEERFNRIKRVLAAWEKPAQTIAKTLDDNQTLIDKLDKAPKADSSNTLFDLFLILVPRHLAIAPPQGSQWTTKIDVTFTDICTCDPKEDGAENDKPEQGDRGQGEPGQDYPAQDKPTQGNPGQSDPGNNKPEKCKCDAGPSDHCCGPELGYWTLRQRFIGPYPYLIEPKYYMPMLCCLVKARYEPAEKELAEAEVKVFEAETSIAQAKGLIASGIKDFEKNAKAQIPGNIECCGEKLPKPDKPPTQAAN